MHPEAEIATDRLRAVVCLPDAERGYYRGTRFDWSGVIASLRHDGHEYFGPWFERHDPTKHDGIVGPAEEFRFPDGGLGYAEAAVGGTFVRIGVGVLRKPDEAAYRQFGTYEIVDPGRWTVRKGADQVEFEHELRDGSGYSYVYRKTIRLGTERPELWLEHALRNAGRRPIEAEQYNHNFFAMGGRTMGPELSVEFAFEPRPLGDLGGLMAVRGRRLVYQRKLERGERVLTRVQGFGSDVSDHDITIEDRGTGAGVRIRGDRPLSDLVFWSIRTTVCPEPYVALSVAPGGETAWKTQYVFYPVSAGV